MSPQFVTVYSKLHHSRPLLADEQQQQVHALIMPLIKVARNDWTDDSEAELADGIAVVVDGMWAAVRECPVGAISVGEVTDNTPQQYLGL